MKTNWARMLMAGLAAWVGAGPVLAVNYNDAAAGNWSDTATWGGSGYPASAADNATIRDISSAEALTKPVRARSRNDWTGSRRFATRGT